MPGNKCGDTEWKAARNKRCKIAKLDETGLDIAGCRHCVAQFAVNMNQGELYGYAHYILTKKFLKKPLIFFGKISCANSGNGLRSRILFSVATKSNQHCPSCMPKHITGRVRYCVIQRA